MDVNRTPQTSYIIAIISVSVVITGAVFSIILVYYYDRPDYLSGVGQLAGALFSVWALLGLIIGQAFQYRSLVMQSQSLRAQEVALTSELNAAKLTNLALAADLLYNATIRSQTAFERYSRSMIVTSPSLDQSIVPQMNQPISDDTSNFEFSFYIVNNEQVLDAIVNDSANGLMPAHIAAYVNLYETLQQSSAKLSKESGSSDLFSIIYDNTPVSQLYAVLRRIKI